MSRRVLSLQQHMAKGQLPLFMTGSEIREHIGSNTPDIRTGETVDEMWERKKAEAQYPGTAESTRAPKPGEPSLEESIRREGGMSSSVRIMPTDEGSRLLDGHHRIAAAENIDPNMLIPVRWHEKNVRFE